jgi:hypothetical protein
MVTLPVAQSGAAPPIEGGAGREPALFSSAWLPETPLRGAPPTLGAPAMLEAPPTLFGAVPPLLARPA